MTTIQHERHSVKNAILTPVEKLRRSFPAAYEKANGYWAHDDNPRFDFRVEEDGHVSIHPWTSRSAEQVLAMGEPPLKLADLYPKNGDYKPVYREKQFDLVTLSHYLKLPHRFLFSLGYRDEYPYKNKQGRKVICVKLGGYCDPEGVEHSKVKVRLSIDGKVRFLWDQRTPGTPIPCGLHRLDEARRAGYVCIGEGESDAATMWFHGFPFLGISGADAVKQLDVSLLRGIERIYIIEEPDQAQKNQETGQGFYGSLHQHLRDNGYTGEIFSIRFKLATGYKDPSSLHKCIYRDCDQTEEAPHLAEIKMRFREKFERALQLAIPEGNHSLATQEDIQPEPLPASPVTESERLQWFSQLCAVDAKVLSPAHKIVLMVIILHSPIWNTTGEYWWKVDAEQLAPLAAMPKKTFLAHLAYLTDKIALFTKRHVKIWYTPEGAKKPKCTTDLYIQPGEHAWLSYPSTYRVVEGAEERNHGGPRTPKPKCVFCESEDLDIDEVQVCRKCRRVHIIHKTEPEPEAEEQEPVESTADVLPLEEEENTPEKYSEKSNLGIYTTLSLYDPQVGNVENTPGNPKLGISGVSIDEPPPNRPTICCNAGWQWNGERYICEHCQGQQERGAS